MKLILFITELITIIINKNYLEWSTLMLSDLPDLYLTSTVLKFLIKNFDEKVLSELTDDQHVLFIPRIKHNNGKISTLCDLQRLNKNDVEYITNHLENLLNLKADFYQELPIISIIIDYGIRDGVAPSKSFPKDIPFQTYYHYKFPITMNPLEYGKLVRQYDNDYIISLESGNTAIIKSFTDKNEVEIIKNGDHVLNYTDYFINNNSFNRKIGQYTYTYVDGSLELVQSKKRTSTISKKKISKKPNENFITMDLETQSINNKLIPYCVGLFDGKIKKSFYLSDYNSVDSMIESAISSILNKSYKNYRVYIHNLSNFDGIFLIKSLKNLGDIEPVINDGRIISIELRNDDRKLIFLDSYQLLPSSLRSLAKNFNVENKDIFPYKFLINI